MKDFATGLMFEADPDEKEAIDAFSGTIIMKYRTVSYAPCAMPYAMPTSHAAISFCFELLCHGLFIGNVATVGGTKEILSFRSPSKST
jgi:hypothetical protein